MKTGHTRIQHILQLMKLYLNKRSSTVCFSTIQRTFYLFKCTLYGPRHKDEPENNHKIQKVHTRNLKTVSVCTRVIRNGLTPETYRIQNPQILGISSILSSFVPETLKIQEILTSLSSNLRTVRWGFPESPESS